MKRLEAKETFLLMISLFAHNLFFNSSLYSQEIKEDRPVVVIIGSGIAGLSAAYFLGPKYKIEVLESRGRTGGNHIEASIEQEDHRNMNLGASHVPAHDSYSRQMFKEFNIPLSPIKLNEVGADFDGKKTSLVSPYYLAYFTAQYSTIHFLSKFSPFWKEQITVSDVLNALPLGDKRKALLSISYDPFIQGDLKDVLFVPYMNYIFWLYSGSGLLAPWGSLTSRHLLPQLQNRDGFQLSLGVKKTEVDLKAPEAQNPKYEIKAYDKDGVLIKTILADKIIYAGHPQEGGAILEKFISSEFSEALKGSYYRKGTSLLVKRPREFQEKSIYFMARKHNKNEVNAMIDHQGLTSHSRIFFMANCRQEDILRVLGLKEEDIIEKGQEFVHYAPDSKSNYGRLLAAYKKEKSTLAKKGIYFSSYNFDPSGFHNADQSIAMAVETVKDILTRDGVSFPENLVRFLALKKSSSLLEKVKRKFLNNHP